MFVGLWLACFGVVVLNVGWMFRLDFGSFWSFDILKMLLLFGFLRLDAFWLFFV